MEKEVIIAQIKSLLAIYGLNIIAAIAIFVIGKWAVGRLREIIFTLMTKRGVDETLARFATSLAYGLMMAFVIIARPALEMLYTP